MKIFILDDELDRLPRSKMVDVLRSKHELTLARSFKEAKKVYKGGYDLLLLDHDMEGFFEDSDYPNTGYQFVKWLVSQEKFKDRPKVFLHSHNPDGRRNMRILLETYNYPCEEQYFGVKYVKFLETI